jgi:class 3 adenylate cyclase
MFIEEQILTPEIRGQRTLAAIVFTDVVSYSALMAANEEYTLDLLRRDFQINEQLCQRFEGKVLKTIGDALLMYFSSAVKAVSVPKKFNQAWLSWLRTSLQRISYPSDWHSFGRCVF